MNERMEMERLARDHEARPIAIIAAMQEEVRELHDLLVIDEARSRVGHGMRDYWYGQLWGKPTVIVWSRWGKVAAATTTTHVLQTYNPREVLFTGVAGALSADLQIGDMVVADAVIHHDLDARPLFGQYEIPLLGASDIPTDPDITEALINAADDFLSDGARRGERGARVGQIASGDQFIASAERVAQLRAALPQALAVEMEGAAVGQVCWEHSVPFGLLRTISDDGGDNSAMDFQAFLTDVASRYSVGVLERYFMRKHP